ncbi:MAG: hypothetical protein KKF58_02005 [Gammaproteobacteria bacterium]|nr:hypothetical protein [Gammaproteobacteria bacterium]
MNTPSPLQRIARLGLILMMWGSMSACSNDQHWKEEVQLSDGRIIVVERDLITESGGDEWALNRSGSKPKEYRIRFEYPNGSGKTVQWRSTKIDVQTWPEMPLVLDVESDSPVVFSSGYVRGCQMYFKYIWRNGAWIENNLPPKFEKRATNLLVFDGLNGRSLFDLEAKRKNNSDVTLKIFSQVGPKHPYCR